MAKVKSKSEVMLEAQKEQLTVHFDTLEFEPKFQTYKGRVVFRGDRSERRFWLLCSIQRARFVCISNDGRTSNGCQCTATEMCRSSGRRRINLHFGQHGGRFNIIETSQDRMSRYLDTSTADTSGQYLARTSKVFVVLLGRNQCVHPFCRIIVGKIVRKSSIGIRMGTNTGLRLFLRASKARSMLIGIRVMTSK